MQKMGWLPVVRGDSRSTAMSPFDRAHTTSQSILIETMSIFYRFRDIAGYLSKVADFDPPHLHSAPSYGGDPGRISWRSLASENQSPPWLSCGVVYVILRLAVLVELRLVTDGHRQTQAHGQYRGCIASRGKNLNLPKPYSTHTLATTYCTKLQSQKQTSQQTATRPRITDCNFTVRMLYRNICIDLYIFQTCALFYSRVLLRFDSSQ